MRYDPDPEPDSRQLAAMEKWEQSHCADCGKEEKCHLLCPCRKCGRLVCDDCVDNSFMGWVCKSCGREIDADTNCPDCNEDHEGPDLRRCLEHEKDECQRVVDNNRARIEEIEKILGGQDASRHF